MAEDTLSSNRVIKGGLVVTPQDKAALEAILKDGGVLAKIVIQNTAHGVTGQTIYTIEVYVGEKNEGIRIIRKINDEEPTFRDIGTIRDRLSLVSHLEGVKQSLIFDIQLSDVHGQLLQAYITALIAFVEDM